MRLTRRERKALREYVSALAERIPNRLESVVLFGSKARGRGRSTRDTDVAVVVKGGRTPRLRMLVTEPTFEPIARFGVDLSPLLISSSAFRKGSPLIQRIKREGIPVWSRGRNLLPAA